MILACTIADEPKNRQLWQKKTRFRWRTVFAKNLGFGVGFGYRNNTTCTRLQDLSNLYKLECGPMPNMIAELPNIGGVLCLTPQSLADAH